ncbi:MAG: RNA-binding S4 domain-containing protein [bacterium]|nr:RNA-binding S4 domain-containing protein [bacterium]
MTSNESPVNRIVEINVEPVELCKILKFENMVQSGGEAKFVISEGLVRLNGEVETRKRKKIFAGDIIEYKGEKLKIARKIKP